MVYPLRPPSFPGHSTCCGYETVLMFSETAWCYLHGIGTKKNVKRAARYYRMAEKQGVKSVGLSWIWKEKYDQKEEKDVNGVRRSATDEQDTPKKGKKLFGRKNTA